MYLLHWKRFQPMLCQTSNTWSLSKRGRRSFCFLKQALQKLVTNQLVSMWKYGWNLSICNYSFKKLCSCGSTFFSTKKIKPDICSNFLFWFLCWELNFFVKKKKVPKRKYLFPSYPILILFSLLQFKYITSTSPHCTFIFPWNLEVSIPPSVPLFFAYILLNYVNSVTVFFSFL